MRQIALVALAFVTALACSGDKESKPGETPSPPATTSTPPVSAGASDAGAATTALTHLRLVPGEFATVGIASCDDYVSRQRECLEKNAPEAIRKAQLDGLQSIAAKWAEASKADRREQLEKTCAHMQESSAKATKAWGCAW